MLFFWTLFQYYTVHIFNINYNKKCFLSSKSVYQDLISEESCDTEDWSNAENTALIMQHKNKLHFKIYSNRKWFFLIVIIRHNYSFYCICFYILFFYMSVQIHSFMLSFFYFLFGTSAHTV